MRMLLRVNGLLLHCIPLCKHHVVASLLFLSDFSVVFWGLTRDWIGEGVFGVEMGILLFLIVVRGLCIYGYGNM